MTKGTTVGYMAVVASVLLATMTSVYADHAATGKGTYSVLPPVVLAEFHFVVAGPGPNPDLEPGLNFVQSEITGRDGFKPFQTFMISTATDFTIPPESAENGERTVTIIGEMVSTIFLGVGEERKSFAELVTFTAVGVDKRTPEAGADLFSLEVTYSAEAEDVQGQLFARLGFGKCDGKTCTIKLKGLVKRGDIFVHTSGGD
jgi:hypothetical protein